MPDMRINPATGQNMTDLVVTDKLQSRKAMQAVNDQVVGFKPLGQRTGGSGKLWGYHIANALTFGLVGTFGAYAANSSVMGSQKDGGWTGMWKDLGQTHLNATLGANGPKAQRSAGEKFVNFMARTWSHIPSLATAGLAALPRISGHVIQNARKKQAFLKAYKAEFGAPPTRALTENLSSAKVVDKASGGFKARLVKRVANEAKAATNGFQHNMTAKTVLNGSPEMRALFAEHLKQEFCPEVLMGYDWGQTIAKDLPEPVVGADALTKLQHQSANYRLSKFDVACGYRQLIEPGAPYENNIDHRLRSDLTGFMDSGQTGMQDFRTRWNAEQQLLRGLKGQLANATGVRNVFTRRQLKSDIALSKMRLDQMRNETLSPQHSKAVGRMIGDVMSANYHLMNDAATRFRFELENSAD